MKYKKLKHKIEKFSIKYDVQINLGFATILIFIFTTIIILKIIKG